MSATSLRAPAPARWMRLAPRMRALGASSLAVLAACASNAPERLTAPAPSTPAPALTAAKSDAPSIEGAVEGATTGADAPGASAKGEAVPVAASAPALGWIAGQPLTYADLLKEWHSLAGRDVFLVLEKVVTMRLGFAEAGRLGIRLAPEAVELRVTEERSRLTRELAATGRDISLDDFVRQRHGVKPKVYFDRLREAVIAQMVTERAVRAWTLSNEWARVRMILVKTAEDMAAVETELAAGAAFATVAKAKSLDDSAEQGGLMPFLVHQEESPLAGLAFTTDPGELAGPIEVQGHRVLLLVEERHAPLDGDWDAVSADVERSLSEYPVEDSEFVYWKFTIEGRYPIDVTPLKELLGIDG